MSNVTLAKKQIWDTFTNQHPFFTQPLATYQLRAKVEMPEFDGNKKSNVEWINKAEEYFEIYDINDDDEKLRHASMKMEGEPYNWYMWWKKTTRIISWRKFKDELFKRFQGVKEEVFFSKVIKLRQKGSVDEYTQEWETLVTRVHGLSESRLIQSYVSGLKTHLQVELEMHDIT